MWPRIVEVMLGLWLVLSPLIFRLGPEDTTLRLVDLACGAAVAAFSLIAIRFRLVRIAILLVGLWLIGYGYVAGWHPSPPGYKNLIIVGGLVSVLSLIPTDCLEPTRSWRDYYAGQQWK
jgi:hypothetical protein